MSKIYDEITSLKTNKEKVSKWFELGLSPKYGLSSEMTILMYQLYQDSSGDSSYNGKYSCGACADTIHRKLQDFMNYGDNLGQPLINWEAIVEAPEAPEATDDTIISTEEVKPSKKKKKDNE